MRELEEISVHMKQVPCTRGYHMNGNYMLAAHAELYKMSKQQFQIARTKVC